LRRALLCVSDLSFADRLQLNTVFWIFLAAITIVYLLSVMDGYVF
jgi:hypothetical protein